MRSEEVENNINLLITYRGNLWQQHKNPKIAKAIDETIDYIEELEERNNNNEQLIRALQSEKAKYITSRKKR